MLPISRHFLLFFLPIFYIFDKFICKGITIMSNAQEAVKTRHKETSLI
ncbi:sodium-potassium/proton antiporter ChaA, partial [Shigella flexneri]